MNKLSKTSHHLSVCSANYRRIKKILTNFTEKEYKFLLDETDLTASFKIIDKQNHTLLIEATQSTCNSIMGLNLDCKSFWMQDLQRLFHIKMKSQFHSM